MKNTNILFIALLLWLLVGLVLGLDYTNYTSIRGVDILRYGISIDSLAFVYQLLFFMISTALISIAFRTESIKLANLLVLTELSIWLIKLVLLKDGYMVGIAGAPDEEIVIYDFVALSLRLLLLLSFYRVGYKVVNLATALIIASFIIYLKASLLSEPICYLPN